MLGLLPNDQPSPQCCLIKCSQLHLTGTQHQASLKTCTTMQNVQHYKVNLHLGLEYQ